MKSVFISLLLFLSLVSFSQTYKPKTFTLTREKIKTAEKVQEIIPDCPEKCGFAGWILMRNISGNIREYSVMGSKITPALRDFMLSDSEKKPKFFIDNVNCSCQAKLFKSYQFTIIE